MSLAGVLRCPAWLTPVSGPVIVELAGWDLVFLEDEAVPAEEWLPSRRRLGGSLIRG